MRKEMMKTVKTAMSMRISDLLRTGCVNLWRRKTRTILTALSMTWFYCLIGFKMTADGVLRGAGDMKLFTVANLVNLGIRVLVAVTMAPRFGIFMVWAAVPVGWTANWLISYCRYRTGKWEKR